MDLLMLVDSLKALREVVAILVYFSCSEPAKSTRQSCDCFTEKSCMSDYFRLRAKMVCEREDLAD